MRITDKQIELYLRHGYTIIPNFLTPDEISAAKQNLHRYVPTPDELAQTPERYPHIHDDPEHLQFEFPFAGDALNHISTHPDLLAFAEKVLGTQNILLSQAATWAKYAALNADYEQGLHLDYQGNSLVVPRDDGAYRQINMILYYTDVTQDLGPTYVVSQEKTRNLPLWPTHRTRKKDPQLYKDERPVLANAGDLFLFSMRTWHRASSIEADAGYRLSHHMVYRSADFPFQGYHQWSRFGENPDLERFIATTTPKQRQALGFPAPGDPYWTPETLAAVQLRYPQMDLKPYRSAVRA
jgi:hypothetical protein